MRERRRRAVENMSSTENDGLFCRVKSLAMVWNPALVVVGLTSSQNLEYSLGATPGSDQSGKLLQEGPSASPHPFSAELTSSLLDMNYPPSPSQGLVHRSSAIPYI